MIVATLVSVDHLGESSRLGRMFSEQIASRFVQRGIPVAEVRLREQLALQTQLAAAPMSLAEAAQFYEAETARYRSIARSIRLQPQ